ncbi:Carbonic anhydrase [Citrus sinensis]|uniref:alpha carbonic anhydrase 1, chloroplastic-like n=1 Tax=Citrus sinensis TaxID=2711 RepID=UPI0003D6E73A|nr:alpha carbonic anhydrase 1, chloroplastic-like [Citrus sinensis]KAH9674577.1 Carbonic anhydrase [Citrus sinensis]
MVLRVAIVVALSLLFNAASAMVEQGIAEVRFSYVADNGPENWGKLSPNFNTCSTGKHQSPVDIMQNKTAQRQELGPLSKEYYSVNATLMNSGYSIGVHYEGKAGELNINGKKYVYKQMHWHTPSEHTINGERFAAELHLVHQTEEKDVAVVAILYKYGDPNPVVTKLMPYLPQLTRESCTSNPKTSDVDVGMMDRDYSRQPLQGYYRYHGSLTTPPCSENVVWTVLARVRSISEEQVTALRAPLCKDCKFNSRPVQPLNDRKVELFKVHKKGRVEAYKNKFVPGSI